MSITAIVLGKEVTLPDPSNNQQVFNYVAEHLLMQNTQALLSSTRSNNCAYRAQRGCVMLACAAGCLIPDADYDPSWEQTAVVPARPDANAISMWFRGRGYNLDLLLSLQRTHDACLDPNNWPACLRRTAEAFELDSRIVDEIIVKREQKEEAERASGPNQQPAGDGNLVEGHSGSSE